MTRTSLVVFLGLCFLGSACASKDKKPNQLSYKRTFKAPYETVWRATQQAMLDYPMNINNMDTGQLETLYITGNNRFKAPHLQNEALPSGLQYKINVTLVKGGKKTRVVIVKSARLQKDFFSDPKEVPSDGFEEKAILYRIKREILVEKIIKRQMEKQSQTNTTKKI